MRINRIKLITELEKRDMTQKRLAELSGVSRATINYIKGGKRCADEIGQKIAEALGVTVEEILGRRAKDSRPRLTVEMIKEWYEQTYNEKCESEEDNMFFDIYTKYANDAYQQGVKDSEGVFDIPTGTVNIYPCFAAHEPKPEKMQEKEQYFEETGLCSRRLSLTAGET